MEDEIRRSLRSRGDETIPELWDPSSQEYTEQFPRKLEEAQSENSRFDRNIPKTRRHLRFIKSLG